MSGSAVAPDRRRNPFAVPSGTTLRFGLLVLATTVVVASFDGWQGRPDAARARRFAAYQLCSERRNARMSLFSGRPGAGCGPDPRVVQTWVPLTTVFVFWLLVLAVYWFLPAWRIRRRRYRDLAGARLPDVTRTVEAIRRRTGTGPVSWYLEPLNPRVSALAFGRRRRRHIVLSGGLLSLRTRRPETFEAVVLHELAHVRNRDIDISFLTIAATRIGLPLLLLLTPDAIGWELRWGHGGGAMAEGAADSLGTLLLVLVLPLSRRWVLRSREFYADARARQWHASRSALRSLFAHGRRRRRLTGGLLRVHPDAERRSAMLDDTAPLFRSGFWELFAVGSVLGALYSEISGTYLLNSALGTAADTVSQWLADAVTGTLAGAVLAFLALRADEGFPAGARARVLRAPAWGLACGLALTGGPGNAGVAFALATGGGSADGFLPWTALLATAGYLATRWMSDMVTLWRPAFALLRRPVRTLCALTAAVGALFALVLAWLMELVMAGTLTAMTGVGKRLPDVLDFVLGAGIDLVVRSPCLVGAALIALLLPLLGQAALPGAHPGAGRELRRTVRGGVRWGLWLMAVLVGLGLSGSHGWYVMGQSAATAALVVLAVRTGGRPRPAGRCYAHAGVASVLAAALAFGGRWAVTALLTCSAGRCAAGPAAGAELLVGLSGTLTLLVAAAVPSARRGRAPDRPETGPDRPLRSARRAGRAAAVCGVLSVAAFFSAPLGITVLLGSAAVVLGVRSHTRAVRARALGGPVRGRAPAATGIICGGLAAVCALLLGLLGTAAHHERRTAPVPRQVPVARTAPAVRATRRAPPPGAGGGTAGEAGRPDPVRPIPCAGGGGAGSGRRIVCR